MCFPSLRGWIIVLGLVVLIGKFIPACTLYFSGGLQSADAYGIFHTVPSTHITTLLSLKALAWAKIKRIRVLLFP